MDAVTEAVQAAHDASADLAAHPNSKTHLKARTMALVALVKAVEAARREAGESVTGAQTTATKLMGYKDRQLINRHMRRAAERGWVETGWRRPRQTEITDLVEVETIDPTVTMWPADATGETPPDKPPILPPFSLPEPYAY